MNKYVIKVSETLSKGYIVEANTLDEAIEKVQTEYENDEIVLEYDDFTDSEIEEAIISVESAEEFGYPVIR